MSIIKKIVLFPVVVLEVLWELLLVAIPYIGIPIVFIYVCLKVYELYTFW